MISKIFLKFENYIIIVIGQHYNNEKKLYMYILDSFILIMSLIAVDMPI